ncbi:MAG: hypothetical protein K6G83_16155 [Lachnospiraceae bacterium]|nr:hypothetical protein [Lachnospiraceae bacterium]
MAHELFHVLTRNHPEFKENMYRLIGFTVDEKEPAFTEEVRAQICSNPDVESYNNHGTFIVKGEPVEATIVTVFDGEYQSGDVMLEHVVPALVPIDSPDHIIPLEDVDNFYEVVGSNTKYVIAAEECLADNFSFAIANGLDEDYATPAIPAAMIDYLSTGEETVPVTGEAAAEAAEEVIEEAEEIETEIETEEAEEAEETEATAEGDKSVDEIAHEVVRGLWGDGVDRVEALEEAGYDPVAVQERVNELMM